MKIVFLLSHTKSLRWFFMDTMNTLIQKGHSVIACGNEDVAVWKDYFWKQKIVYKRIPVQRNGINPFADLYTLFSIIKLLKTIKPDKIFAFQAKTVIYGGIAARTLGIKEFYPLFAGAGSVFLENSLLTKLVRCVLVQEYRIAVNFCEKVFFQNTDDEQLFRSHKIIDKQQVVLLHGSGVNVNHFNVQPLPERCAFLCVSRLIRDKGVMEYLQASADIKKRHPETRCMLVGPFDSNISAISREDLKCFTDLGIEYFGEQDDVRPFIRQCSVFVLPSYREGTPKAVLEAMSSGRAIITTDAPGCRETVLNNYNGIQVPVKNVNALVGAMEYLMSNQQVVIEMGQCSRKLAEEVFSTEKVDKAVCEVMGLN